MDYRSLDAIRIRELNLSGRKASLVADLAAAYPASAGVRTFSRRFEWNGASTVSRIDPRTNALIARVPVAAEVAAVAVGEGAVWVASDNGTLTRIDPEANVATTTIDLGGALSDVAVGAGAVWVANIGARNVARIDPKTNEVVARIATGTPPDGIAVGDDAVWVTAY